MSITFDMVSGEFVEDSTSSNKSLSSIRVKEPTASDVEYIDPIMPALAEIEFNQSLGEKDIPEFLKSVDVADFVDNMK